MRPIHPIYPVREIAGRVDSISILTLEHGEPMGIITVAHSEVDPLETIQICFECVHVRGKQVELVKNHLTTGQQITIEGHQVYQHASIAGIQYESIIVVDDAFGHINIPGQTRSENEAYPFETPSPEAHRYYLSVLQRDTALKCLHDSDMLPAELDTVQPDVCSGCKDWFQLEMAKNHLPQRAEALNIHQDDLCLICLCAQKYHKSESDEGAEIQYQPGDLKCQNRA